MFKNLFEDVLQNHEIKSLTTRVKFPPAGARTADTRVRDASLCPRLLNLLGRNDNLRSRDGISCADCGFILNTIPVVPFSELEVPVWQNTSGAAGSKYTDPPTWRQQLRRLTEIASSSV